MEATRAYPVPTANAPRPAWSPGCAGLRPAPFGHIRWRPLAPIPCPLPMPPDRRGRLGARASGPHRLATFDDWPGQRRPLAPIPCPLPMPPDRRGHLGARASGPHRLATFDGGHSRLSRARCQCLSTGVVTWVHGPPARTVWPHSRTDQGSGGHSRLSRARCQCLPTSVVTWVRGPTAHIMRGAETHRFVHQPTFLFLPPSPASGGEPVLAMRQQV